MNFDSVHDRNAAYDYMLPHIADTYIKIREFFNDDISQEVKRGIAIALGNMANDFPGLVELALDRLEEQNDSV